MMKRDEILILKNKMKEIKGIYLHPHKKEVEK